MLCSLKADDPVLLNKLIEFFSLELHTRDVNCSSGRWSTNNHSNATHWNLGDGFLVATTNLWMVFLSLWKVHGCVCVCVCVFWVFQFHNIEWVELPSCIRQFSQIWLKTKHEALLAVPTKAKDIVFRCIIEYIVA